MNTPCACVILGTMTNVVACIELESTIGNSIRGYTTTSNMYIVLETAGLDRECVSCGRNNGLISNDCCEPKCDDCSALWHKHPKRISHNLQVFTVIAVEHYQYNFEYRKLAMRRRIATTNEDVDMLTVSICHIAVLGF